MQIRKRIKSNFSEFRKKGCFIDCTLSFEDHEISVHKIILAKYSKFFKNEFINNMKNPYIFKVSYDPQGMLEKVIDFLYENTIDVDQNNVIALLAISRYYQIGHLEEMMVNYITQHDYKDNALDFCQKCVEYKIQDQACHFTQIIAQDWNKYERQKIFKHVDATVLSQILIEEKMKKLSQDAKIQIIDEYFDSCDVFVISESERKKLTEVIDWTEKNAYQYLTRHKCEWIHPKTERVLRKRLLQERRALASNLADELKQSDLSDTVDSSKWFLFTRMINIRQANPEQDSDKHNIPIINYISSYGDQMEGYDAITTGAITVDSSPVMSKDIQVNYALGTVKDQKFISIGSEKFHPYYELNFGPKAKLLVNTLKVTCSDEELKKKKIENLINKKTKEDANLYPNPTTVQVIGHQTFPVERDVVLYDGEFSENIDISTEDIPLSKIKFVQIGKNVAGNYILRIFKIEIQGEFVL